MRHLDILKQAFWITWRYRALWVFGFLLALCGGGSGGSGGNFNFPSGEGGDFEGDVPNLPEIPPEMITALAIGAICLILLLVVVGVVVRAVTRTALIRMVRQITVTEAVTVREGWRLGWSSAAWRLFLVGLIINIPLAIIFIGLILLAFSPLVLLIFEETALTILGVVLTVIAFLFVLLLIILLSAIVTPILELAWRRTVLAGSGVIASIREAIDLIRGHLKDVIIVWLLLFGVGIGWVLVSLIVFFVSLMIALIVGGLPALLVYLISESWIGAAVAGAPLGLLVLILITSFVSGLFLIFQSSVWTLTYFGLQEISPPEPGDTSSLDSSSPSAQEV